MANFIPTGNGARLGNCLVPKMLFEHGRLATCRDNTVTDFVGDVMAVVGWCGGPFVPGVDDVIGLRGWGSLSVIQM